MLPKSFSLLMLVVAIQFSQSFAAPKESITQNESDLSIPAVTTGDGISMEPINEPTMQPTVEDVGKNFEDSMQSVNDQIESVADSQPFVEKPTEHLSHMLTREQELRILHEIPEFTEIIQAMERLPDDVYMELKNFLTSTVPRMPHDNIFTKHFENAQVLVQMFERLIKVARTEGAVHTPASEELFNRVHKAAPEMKTEMDQFNGFMEDAKLRLASLGTSTNPMDSMAQPPTAGINVSAGSVSLPVEPMPLAVEEKSEDFVSEFAPAPISAE